MQVAKNSTVSCRVRSRRLNSEHLDRAGAKNRAVYSGMGGEREEGGVKNEFSG